MSMLPLRKLLGRWVREELTAEYTMGQILQHLIELEKRLGALEKRLHQLAANQKQ